MFKFQQARDKLGDAGEHAAWFDNHFNFFNVQQDRDELYEAWKLVELELRRDHRSQNLAFNAADHEFQALLAASQGSKMPPGNNRGSGNYAAKGSAIKPSSRFQSGSQPFLSGSGRSSNPNSNCLVCAERGHTVLAHQDSTTPVKFLDGKAAWSKCTSRGLVTADSRLLCINWNLRGERGGPLLVPTAKTSGYTSVHSVAARATTLSPGLVVHNPPTSKDFISIAHSPRLRYIDFSASVITRLPSTYSSFEHSLIFDRVSHPYDPNAFDIFLSKHDLSSDYPLLSFNLRHGFPLGHMPEITSTIVIPNNLSILGHMDTVEEYLCKELLSGRMSGPFSREEVETILRGPFQSSPLIVSVQPQSPGVPDKLRVCRHLSKATKTHASVNSHIRKEDFPTRFDLASKVADMVSIFVSITFPNTFFLFIILSFAFRAWGCLHFVALRSLGYLRHGRATRTSCPRRSTACVFSSILCFGIHLGCFYAGIVSLSEVPCVPPYLFLSIVCHGIHFMGC